jgi:hypothetical protein
VTGQKHLENYPSIINARAIYLEVSLHYLAIQSRKKEI